MPTTSLHILRSRGKQSATKHLKGQAYALRAYNYFNLVRQYQFTYAKDPNAKAIPVYIHPTTPATEPNPLSSVSEVYEVILDDLTEAEKLLSGFERTVKNRPDLNVVRGLFARVYQTWVKWELAAEYAERARTATRDDTEHIPKFH